MYVLGEERLRNVQERDSKNGSSSTSEEQSWIKR